MKKFSALLGILFMGGVLGCSGAASDDPPQVIQVPSLENGTDLDPAFLPVRVGHVEIGRSKIDFVRVFSQTDTAIDPPSEDHQEPSIIVMQSGFFGEADPVAEVRASSKLPITTAELYLGLRGQSPDHLPEALALAHSMEAAALGRTPEFVETFRVPLPPRSDEGEEVIAEETTKASLSLPVQVIDSNFTEVIGGRRWTNVQTGANAFSCMGVCPPPTPLPTLLSFWTCSNRASFETIGYYTLPVASSCTKTKTTGWIRVGTALKSSIFNGETATVQGFYGPSTDGQWVAYPAETASIDQYFFWDWNSTGSKSLAFASTRAKSLTTVVRLMSGKSVPN